MLGNITIFPTGHEAIPKGALGGGEVMAMKKPNPIDQHVGTRVRTRRLMLSMSQGKLADAIGLSIFLVDHDLPTRRH
jgi:hypothetical protein